ncbi:MULTISPECIES: hypothetical protein [Mesobacillus]|uniref:hypothetical protein n=1 Tax=Mesobacillus TaxID=2675231 RepID=UPI0017846273|nr:MULTISPECIES: hypothetical protein [Mesobacillus]MCM3571775.1 hypothetical protein [Mesobacillus subterraneus]UYZ20673.1 hypothetical protein FOF60_16605 [Mesobacillus jeotgali]
MEFLLLFGFHLFIMGSLVMLFSGIITFLFPRMHFLITISIFGAVGFLYAFFFEVIDLVIFAVFFNMILSLTAVGLVKLGFYFKKVADRQGEKTA